MFSQTNLQEELLALRQRRMDARSFADGLLSDLSDAGVTGDLGLDLDLLDVDKIVHLTDIKKLCVDFRLRFLPAQYFKGEWPEEAVEKVRQLEVEHDTTIEDLRIIAPAKRLRLENADDPLLMLPLGNDYFYLIHKWGNDLHPFRKWMMWPYKNFENMVFTVFLISVLLTWFLPIEWLHPEPGAREYVLTFLFLFKCVGFVVLYYGFAKGKNFNEAIWNSKYYNG